jgi:hypothetical protein
MKWWWDYLSGPELLLMHEMLFVGIAAIGEPGAQGRGVLAGTQRNSEHLSHASSQLS